MVSGGCLRPNHRQHAQQPAVPLTVPSWWDLMPLQLFAQVNSQLLQSPRHPRLSAVPNTAGVLGPETLVLLPVKELCLLPEPDCHHQLMAVLLLVAGLQLE